MPDCLKYSCDIPQVLTAPNIRVGVNCQQTALSAARLFPGYFWPINTLGPICGGQTGLSGHYLSKGIGSLLAFAVQPSSSHPPDK